LYHPIVLIVEADEGMFPGYNTDISQESDHPVGVERPAAQPKLAGGFAGPLVHLPSWLARQARFQKYDVDQYFDIIFGQ
jgi:hypothetical protein